MEIKASLNYLRISPRKVKLVTDLIKGMEADKAQGQLQFLAKKSAGPVLKLLNSAIANAKHNFNLVKENLYIKDIRVNQAPSLKRWEPRAFGRAFPILRRASHVTIVLEEKGEVKEGKKVEEVERVQKVEKIEKEEKETKPKFRAIKEIGKKGARIPRRIFQRKAI